MPWQRHGNHGEVQLFFIPACRQLFAGKHVRSCSGGKSIGTDEGVATKRRPFAIIDSLPPLNGKCLVTNRDSRYKTNATYD